MPVGGSNSEPLDIMGYTIPPGTIVATQAWSMHRDEDVFPNSDRFMPERWLPCHTQGESQSDDDRIAR